MVEKRRIPEVAKCDRCKRRFDLPTLRERKDYKPGICPMCGGSLKSVYESKPPAGMGSMTVKQKAINLITELGCSYEFTRADYPRHGTEIEVFPPEGYLFDNELGSLACHSWEDVIERLPQFEITKQEVEKTKDHRFGD